MTHRDVELLAIGAGPSNLAVAVALEELGPDDLAENSVVVERHSTVQWQHGLLVPWAKSQVSFLKDLVTLRNPTSRFSFLSYLHSVGRLDDFINMGSFTPYRVEISDYLAWVASSLAKVRVELGRECVAVEPDRGSSGHVTGWVARFADGSSIGSRYLVLGAGRDAYVPPVLRTLPAGRLIHSTQYVPRVCELAKDRPYRAVVVGGAQSSAEMFQALQHDLPNTDLAWVMRSIALKGYEMNKFINELYYPSYIDKFFEGRPEGRAQILAEMHRTNYSGVAPGMLESLYSDLYLDRLLGKNHKRIITMADITGAREGVDEVVLELTDRRTGEVTEHACDLVFLGTGFEPSMPAMISRLGASLDLDQIAVSRHYRLVTAEPSPAACYLQGVNEATHGIADSLLSMQAVRAWEITNDILADRREEAPIPAVPVAVSVN